MSISTKNAANAYLNKSHDCNDPIINAFIAGAQWYEQTHGWKEVVFNDPPPDIEILAKSPEGSVYLTKWRQSHGIFACQNKTEWIEGWSWKYID